VSRELTSRAEPLAFVANPGTDTELWVYRNKEQRDLIFAFRCALVVHCLAHSVYIKRK